LDIYFEWLHVPTKTDWNLLIGFLGEDKVKLKMTSVKFGALIDGFRSLNGA